MPRVEVLFFAEDDGSCPFDDWFSQIRPTARARCLAGLKLLEELGYEMRRPQADVLRDGIYELRVKDERLHYRILYFFHERKAVVLSHGFVKKQAAVPEREIEAALRRKLKFKKNSKKHTFKPGN